MSINMTWLNDLKNVRKLSNFKRKERHKELEYVYFLKVLKRDNIDAS